MPIQHNSRPPGAGETMSPAGRTAGSQGNRGQQVSCCSRNHRRGAAGYVQDKNFNRDRTVSLFPKKRTNFEAESGAITNAKRVEGSLSRLANRRSLKTRYTHSIFNFFGFEIENITWGEACEQREPPDLRQVGRPRQRNFV